MIEHVVVRKVLERLRGNDDLAREYFMFFAVFQGRLYKAESLAKICEFFDAHPSRILKCPTYENPEDYYGGSSKYLKNKRNDPFKTFRELHEAKVKQVQRVFRRNIGQIRKKARVRSFRRVAREAKEIRMQNPVVAVTRKHDYLISKFLESVGISDASVYRYSNNSECDFVVRLDGDDRDTIFEAKSYERELPTAIGQLCVYSYFHAKDFGVEAYRGLLLPFAPSADMMHVFKRAGIHRVVSFSDNASGIWLQ